MKTLVLCLLILTGGISAQATHQIKTALTEDQKIEKLITYIASLNNAIFIRNGSEYTNSKATDYLRYKLKRDKDKISSARDFITIAGTKSNSSGKPLLIRYNGDKTVNLGDILYAELMKIEKGM